MRRGVKSCFFRVFLEYLLDPASVSTGTKIKPRLLENGFIEQEKISVPNGSVTLLKLAEQGKTLVALSGIEVKGLPKNASLEHEYWKELVAKHYREMGYEVEKELNIGEGKAVDLVATKGNERIAIEVETGKSDAIGNIEKDLETGFDKVVSMIISEDVKDKIDTEIQELGLNKNKKIKVYSI